jgi:hypothetical protein
MLCWDKHIKLFFSEIMNHSLIFFEVRGTHSKIICWRASYLYLSYFFHTFDDLQLYVQIELFLSDYITMSTSEMKLSFSIHVSQCILPSPVSSSIRCYQLKVVDTWTSSRKFVFSRWVWILRKGYSTFGCVLLDRYWLMLSWTALPLIRTCLHMCSKLLKEW